MNAAFVAEARRTYVPAAKWARANGATFHRKKWSTFSDSRWIKDGSCVIWRRPWLCFHEDALNKRFDVCPTSVEQAIDYLVTAGVLPVPMHSLMQVDAETARLEAECRAGGQLIFADVHGYAPAAVSGQELWLDIHDDLRWRAPEDAGKATEQGWRRLWVVAS